MGRGEAGFPQGGLEGRLHHRDTVHLLDLQPTSVGGARNQRLQMCWLNLAVRQQRAAAPLEVENQPAILEHDVRARSTRHPPV